MDRQMDGWKQTAAPERKQQGFLRDLKVFIQSALSTVQTARSLAVAHATHCYRRGPKVQVFCRKIFRRDSSSILARRARRASRKVQKGQAAQLILSMQSSGHLRAKTKVFARLSCHVTSNTAVVRLPLYISADSILHVSCQDESRRERPRCQMFIVAISLEH